MATNENLNVKITADAKQAKSELQQTQSIFDGFTRSILQLATLKLSGDFFKSTIQSAIQTETTILAISNSLGSSASVITDWAKNNATAFSMSESGALNFSGTFQNLISNFENDTGTIANLTTDMLETVSTVASTTGRTMEDVTERIRSGLLGNTEAIEDLGVYINVSMIESTEAFKRFAGDKSWAQLDFQIQQQIRYYAILEQSVKKYGSVPLDTPTQQLAKVTAEIENLKNKIGEELTPIALEFAESFADTLNFLEPVIVGIASALSAISPLSAVIGVASVGIVTLIYNFGKFIELLGKAKTAVMTLTVSATGLQAAFGWIGLAGIAIAGLITLVDGLTVSSEELAAAQKEIKTSIYTELNAEINNNYDKKLVDMETNVRSSWADTVATAENNVNKARTNATREISKREQEAIKSAQKSAQILENEVEKARTSAINAVQKSGENIINQISDEYDKKVSDLQKQWNIDDHNADMNQQRDDIFAEQIEKENELIAKYAEESAALIDIKEAAQSATDGLRTFNILEISGGDDNLKTDEKKKTLQEELAELYADTDEKLEALDKVNQKYFENLKKQEEQEKIINSILDEKSAKIEVAREKIEAETTAIQESAFYSEQLDKIQADLTVTTDNIKASFDDERSALDDVTNSAQATNLGFIELSKTLAELENTKHKIDVEIKYRQNYIENEEQKELKQTDVYYAKVTELYNYLTQYGGENDTEKAYETARNALSILDNDSLSDSEKENSYNSLFGLDDIKNKIDNEYEKESYFEVEYYNLLHDFEQNYDNMFKYDIPENIYGSNLPASYYDAKSTNLNPTNNNSYSLNINNSIPIYLDGDEIARKIVENNSNNYITTNGGGY
jgi:hypothetical protein